MKISEERFQFALDANEQGVWDWDLVTNKVYYSLQSRMILEIGVEEKADSPEVWDERIHPDDKVAYFADIQKHFENITPYYQNYHRVLSKSGEYKWILDRGKVVLRDELGNPLRIIGTHNDISAQKIKEDELIKTLGIVSEQNTRLLNFAHIVSHNLRSHAGNFKMLLDLIESAENREEEQVTLLHLRTISNELSETIEHLNELVGIHSELKPVKESLNLHDYFRKTLNILGEEINKHKVVIHDEIPADIHVQYNPAYLESVLLNFTTNAIKYSHPERHPEIRFKCGEDQRRYVLEITDNGLGIDLERHGESLFGMYKTFHKHPNSRGIGLFITKNQIEAMGGEIEVKSIVGEGTVFKIYFNNEEI
ncbi:sensor histidine kinase [Flavobacterium kingsejongi]|uniref:sensor histidine kinase n=1 Tax=Flavobacterium kingsejongi TaxID=1678728 RepID=UPI001D13097A|nr:PAS domain-containing sensor histidine kinase [Flavobacterium kingsejongi]